MAGAHRRAAPGRRPAGRTLDKSWTSNPLVRTDGGRERGARSEGASEEGAGKKVCTPPPPLRSRRDQGGQVVVQFVLLSILNSREFS